MLGYLILLFTAVPAIELYLLITVGSQIGVLHTIGIIILTGVIGAALARHQGLRMLFEAQRSMNAGKIPTDEMIEGLMILIAGGVLLTPGFLTDAMGFLLLLPPTRALLRQYLKKRFGSHIQTMHHRGPSRYSEGGRHSDTFSKGDEVFDPFDETKVNSTKPKPDIIIESKRSK